LIDVFCWGRRIALLVLLGLFSHLGLAVEVRGMFRESAEVQDQSASQRKAAAQQALGRVLVRVSGTEQVLANAAVRKELGRADAYLGQFSYQKSEDQASSGFRLDMEFQLQPVIEILKQAQQPVWSSNRPAVLACVEVQGSGGQVITASSSSAPVLLAEAKRRGVPLQLPGSSTDCNEASAELLLDGNLQLNGGRCDGRWSMALNNRDRRWTSSGASLEACLGNAVDELAETLSATYAFSAVAGGAAGEPLLLRVAGIDDFVDYADVVLMLNSLAMVDAVDVAGVEGGAVDFSLSTSGSADKLQQAIELKGMLLETAAPPAPAEPLRLPPGIEPGSTPLPGYPAVAAAEPEPERLYYRLASR
jgi:hypothetical protein